MTMPIQAHNQFQDGTKIQKNGITYTVKHGKFIDPKGHVVSPESIFPNNFNLDVTGDKKYDKKDFAKLQQLNKKGTLAETLNEKLGPKSEYFIRTTVPGEGGPVEATTDKNGLNILLNNKRTLESTEVSVFLPKK